MYIGREMRSNTETAQSKRDSASRRQASAGSVWDNFQQIFIAVILALIIKTSVVEAYKIPTASMEDTLLVGDFLLANKFIYGAEIPLTGWRLPAIRDPRAGDIVIFTFPVDGVTKYIKRCVAVGGDTVVIRDKKLFVNGKPFENPPQAKFIDTNLDGSPVIVTQGQHAVRDNLVQYVVPQNHYFMMGDNRDNSYDSRYWHAVPQELILGQAMVIHWSWNEEANPSPEVSVSDPLSVPRLFLFNIMHLYEKVRWDRLFNPIS